MSDLNNQKKIAEYKKFLDSKEAPVPAAISGKIFLQIHELLNPSAWSVFLKIFGIHAAVGFMSLSVCHQFGMNPFGTTRSLDQWLMTMMDHGTCMIVCGVLFLSTSIITAGYFLTVEEVRALKRTSFLQTLGLGILSLVIFAALGAEMAALFSVLWLFGSLAGGYAATEVIWFLKKKTFAT